MKILAIIPARGGSKRLPRKNILTLGGKPLINWSIDYAKSMEEVIDILVTTDDEEISDVARKNGALVPWMRPAELSSDHASSADVAIHALNWYEQEIKSVDAVLFLQPTSPFRSIETGRVGIDLFNKNQRQNVVGVSLTPSHPLWMFKMHGERLVPYCEVDGFAIRSQDLPDVYIVNGSFYLVSSQSLRKNNSLFGGEVIPLLTRTQYESVDIDTEFDFRFAQYLAAEIDESSEFFNLSQQGFVT